MAREVISGIYKIELKDEFKESSNCNGIYIGLSSNVYKRISKHKSTSFEWNNDDYKFLIHKAMYKYGIDNFEYTLIEKCEKEVLAEREIYWIDYYDSYNNGYNMTNGGEFGFGEGHNGSILTWDEVNKIRSEYKNESTTSRNLAEKYNTSKSNILFILHNEHWYDENYDISHLSGIGSNKGINNPMSKINTNIANKIRIFREIFQITYREIKEIFEYGGVYQTCRNELWYDKDWQLFLDNKINIDEFANIKNINIDDLKEWFNNGE